MSDMRQLYQEVILEHNKKPRNFGVLEGATCSAHGHNPLCGDNYTVYVRLEGEQIAQVGFEGEGCAISKASASMMTTRLKGLEVAAAQELVELFRGMILGEVDPEAHPKALKHLKVFQGVSALPVRIKCALLPWHAVKAALDGRGEASTEGEADPAGEGEGSARS